MKFRVGFCISIMLFLVSSLTAQSPVSNQRQFLDKYCVTCHNDRLQTGSLSLEHADVSRPDAQPEIWEKVIRKLRTGVMPPPNMLQPPQADRVAMAAWLENSIDAAWVAK